MTGKSPIPPAIAENARRIIANESRKMQMRLAPLIGAAEDGFAIATEILNIAVLKPGRVHIERLKRLLEGYALSDSKPAASASTADDAVETPRAAADAAAGPAQYEQDEADEGHDFVFPPYMTENEALKRVNDPELDLIGRTPEDVLKDIFEGMEYARQQRSENKPFLILELANRELAERLGLVTLDGLRDARRNGIKVLPPPSSEKYDELLENIVGFKPETLDAWRSWEYWRIALAYQFAGILIGRRNPKPPPGWIMSLERAIGSRAAWYESLSSEGVEDADIEKAIRRFYRNGGFDDLRALAELRRFAKADDEELMQNPHSAGLMASAIKMLHAEAPSMNEDDFLRLLPHYAYPMTVESAAAMLKRENTFVDLTMRRKAEAFLMWHAHPSDAQSEFIASRVRQGGVGYEDLDRFCRDTFGVGAKDMEEKVWELARDGIYAEPLAQDLMEAFPGRIEFDLDALRDAAKSPPAPEEDEEEPATGRIMRAPVDEGGETMKADAGGAGSKSADAVGQQAKNGNAQLALSAFITGAKPKV